jgi:uncharacterized protein
MYFLPPGIPMWVYLIPIPGLILGLYAQFKLRGLYAKYQNVRQSRGMTGAQVAQAILDHAGIRDVTVEQCPGELTDHYDPRNKVLRLSEGNFHASSLSAIGVAAHEAGHAIQHKEKYAPLQARMSIVGLTNFGSMASQIIFGIGLFIPALGKTFLMLGILLFSVVVIFQLITLPVEFDASSRAKNVLSRLGFVNEEERQAIQKVLGAAALTYVAGLVSAVLELLKLIIIANQRRD